MLAAAAALGLLRPVRSVGGDVTMTTTTTVEHSCPICLANEDDYGHGRHGIVPCVRPAAPRRLQRNSKHLDRPAKTSHSVENSNLVENCQTLCPMRGTCRLCAVSSPDVGGQVVARLISCGCLRDSPLPLWPLGSLALVVQPDFDTAQTRGGGLGRGSCKDHVEVGQMPDQGAG